MCMLDIHILHFLFMSPDLPNVTHLMNKIHNEQILKSGVKHFSWQLHVI